MLLFPLALLHRRYRHHSLPTLCGQQGSRMILADDRDPLSAFLTQQERGCLLLCLACHQCFHLLSALLGELVAIRSGETHLEHALVVCLWRDLRDPALDCSYQGRAVSEVFGRLRCEEVCD